MAVEHALVNAAYASFFPSLSLTGVAGSSSPHLRYFLKNKGRWWGYGANSSQMIFDAGRIESEVIAQEFRLREAHNQYQQAVLNCFEEVENGLSNIAKYGKEYADVTEAVGYAKKISQISSNRYSNGVTSYWDVVLAEEEELEREIAQINLLGLQFTSTVQLIKAIGGGWDSPPEEQDTFVANTP